MIRLLSSVVLLVFVSSAHALQVLEVKNGETVHVTTSLTQLTRIGMSDGSRLAGVWGAKTQVKLTKDEDAGEVMIQPVSNKPFSLYVRDEYGSGYTLVVSPINSPGDIILLKPARSDKMTAQAEKSIPYVELLKRMLKTVVANDAADSIPTDGTDVRKVIPLWEEVVLRLDEVRESATLTADIYTLINVSKETIRINESEFEHLSPAWRMIAIKEHELKPTEKTRIYVIRDR